MSRKRSNETRVRRKVSGRAELLIEQQENIKRLKERYGLNFAQIASLTNVSEFNARRWQGNQLANEAARLIIAEAAWSKNAPLAITPTSTRGKLAERDFGRRERLLKECGIDSPVSRSRKLLAMIETLGVSREEFAKLLEVHPRRLYEYLDEGYDLKPSLQAASRIRKLQRQIASGTALESVGQRFRAAALKIFGEEIYRSGFDIYSEARARAIEWLEEVTGISHRTLYRLMPPYDDEFRPTRRIVMAFEQAARLIRPHIRRGWQSKSRQGNRARLLR